MREVALYACLATILFAFVGEVAGWMANDFNTMFLDATIIMFFTVIGLSNVK